MAEQRAQGSIHRPLRRWWVVVAVWCLGLFAAFQHEESEQVSTAHYFPGLEGYYGGYGHCYFAYPERLVAIQSETQVVYRNLEALQLRAPDASHFQPGYDRAGRLASASFLPAAIQRGALGALSMHTSYLIANVLVWAAAVVVSGQLAARLFSARAAPFLASGLAAVYPVFTLMFRSLKIQAAPAVYALVGLYLLECRVRQAPFPRQVAFFACFLLLGQYSGGGGPLFLIAAASWGLARRLLTPAAGDLEDQRPTWGELGRWLEAAMIGLLLVTLVDAHLRARYALAAPSPIYDMRTVFLTGNLGWLRALLSGGELVSERLLGYPGWDLFTSAVPRFVSSLFCSNPAVVTLAPVAFLKSPRARPALLVGAISFLPGHAPEMLVAWDGSYGYGNALTMLLFVVGVGGMLAEALEEPGIWRRAAAVTLLAIMALAFLLRRNDHLDNYYFGWGRLNAVHEVHVYHGERHSRY